MPNTSIKKALYEELAKVGKAVSSSARMELLEYLSQGEKTVEVLSGLSGLSIANTSQHLQLLKNTGLVVSRKDGLYVYYSIISDDVVNMTVAIRQLAEKHLNEVSRIINDVIRVKDKIEPVKAADLLLKIKKGLVTVIDVRPEDEYMSGHLPGSINIPFEDLKFRLHELNPKHEVIAYCRGPYCVMAFDTVNILRSSGYKARRLKEGFPEWKLGGNPVEQSEKKEGVKVKKKKKGAVEDSWVI